MSFGEFTARLPETDRYNLTVHLRRAATPVPRNIAEGSGRSTDAEFARFVGYAYRSLKATATGSVTTVPPAALGPALLTVTV